MQKMYFRLVVASLIALFCYEVNSASPLIFKATKTLVSPGTVELGSFDATRFSQLRIGVVIQSTQISSSAQAAAQLRYDQAKRAYERDKSLLEKGVIAQYRFDEAKDEMDNALLALKQSSEQILPASILLYGVVGNEEVSLATFTSARVNQSVVIDSPPSSIRIRIQGQGTFSVYVWGR